MQAEKTALAIAEKQEVTISADTTFALIREMALNPNVDADKLERLTNLHIKLQDRQREDAYNADMMLLQQRLATVKIDKKGRISFEGKDKFGNPYKQETPYAKIEDIDKVLRPVMHEYGFVATYLTEGTDRVIVKCKITHRGGHYEIASMTLPLDTSGSKNNLQGAGSSISYGKRYTICAMLNIMLPNEDDDGAGGNITDEQAAEIKDWLKTTGADVKYFLKYVKAENVESIKTKYYAPAIAYLKAKAFDKQKEQSNAKTA